MLEQAKGQLGHESSVSKVVGGLVLENVNEHADSRMKTALGGSLQI